MRIKKIIAGIAACAMLASSAGAFAAEVGESLKLGDYSESAAETQKLIDARPDMQRPMENLGRGGVAVRMDGYTYLSWRWLGTESADTMYNVYRTLGSEWAKCNSEPLTATNYVDLSDKYDLYKIVPVVDGSEDEDVAETVSVWNQNYMDIPLDTPEGNSVNGEPYTYKPGDASIGDLDGDGEWEIVLKWDPSNAKDAAQAGYTGECLIDGYKLDGTRMWRINLGPNIRSGAHDTQFMVYDYDLDGKAEVAMRTSDGTVAGDGSVIGDAKKNYAVVSDGKNLTGPLYLTVFKGEDGSVIDTVDYYPQTTGKTAKGVKWDISAWGDTWGNRSERYLAAVGYLDGERPSMLFARGYYYGPEGDVGGRTAIAAFDLIDGKLVNKWNFDTLDIKDYQKLIGQGNHSMSVADVDFDGCDEVIYGSLCVDNDGSALYSTALGHGDAQHVSDLDPTRPGLEVYSCHEDPAMPYGYEMRDARTGELLYGAYTGTDNGRAASGDIDPRYVGAEGWSAAGVLTAADGTVISNSYTMPANFLCYWDGDLGREVLDNIYVSKWNSETQKSETIFTATGCISVNGTKSTPALSADLLGDWREEIMFPTKDGKALRIFTTTEPTEYRIPTLMHDIQYRMHIAYQNTCYNQPPHLSYYLGYDTETVPVPQMYTVGSEAKNSDIKDGTSKWDVDSLYSGEKVELAIGSPTAVANGMPMRIDNDNTDVVPVIDENDRTLVPLRFIAEAFGCEVEWIEASKGIRIIDKKSNEIMMYIGNQKYEVGRDDGYTAGPHGGMVRVFAVEAYKEMDTAPVIMNDRTFVPLRVFAESFGNKVYWNDGLITVSDIDLSFTDEAAAERLNEITNMPVPGKIERIAINTHGEKYYDNQLDVYGVTASDNDGNKEEGAVDLDINTRWSAWGPNTLVIDLGETAKDVTGVAIACWKGAERVYPFTIEYSTDGEAWETALPKSQNTGESDGFEKFMFPEPVTAKYIRYSGDGATDPTKNYCHISEIAILGAE